MFIKRPGKGRKSYSIVGDDGKVVRDARIDAINKELGAGAPRDVLEARLKNILREFKPRPPQHDLLDLNEQLARKALARAVLRRSDMAYPKGRELRLLAAARFMSPLIIQDASEEALLTRLSQAPSPKRRFEYTARVNEMLGCIGRPALPNARPRKLEEPHYISIATFLAKAEQLEPEYRAYLGALFATGCRMAELPEIKFKTLDRADISRQWHTRRLSVWTTKNKKDRTAPTLPELRPFIQLLPDKMRMRYLCTAGVRGMRSRCQKVLGCRIHDLRHSYCVALAEAGFSSHRIARYIGDTVDVVETYYRNWLATDEELLAALKKLG
jgi:integrase